MKGFFSSRVKFIWIYVTEKFYITTFPMREYSTYPINSSLCICFPKKKTKFEHKIWYCKTPKNLSESK